MEIISGRYYMLLKNAKLQRLIGDLIWFLYEDICVSDMAFFFPGKLFKYKGISWTTSGMYLYIPVYLGLYIFKYETANMTNTNIKRLFLI